MIKLVNLLEDTNMKDFINKGFKLGKPTLDSETGKIGNKVEYLPDLSKLRLLLVQYKKDIQPFKFSQHQDIVKISKNILSDLNNLGKMIYALEKLIELHEK